MLRAVCYMSLLRCDSVLLGELFSRKGCGAFIFSASDYLTYWHILEDVKSLIIELFNLVSSEDCVIHSNISIRPYCYVGMQLGSHHLSASISYVQ